AQRIIDMFYPLPNQEPLSNGFGVFQQFIPKSRNRERADLRIDHEFSATDSTFFRASYQNRNPSAFLFEAGSALTNLPVEQQSVATASAIAGWTRIFSSSVVNELRAGYNYDRARRQSTFVAADVNAQLGLESEPSLAADARGFPAFLFTGANRPLNIADRARNA